MSLVVPVEVAQAEVPSVAREVAKAELRQLSADYVPLQSAPKAVVSMVGINLLGMMTVAGALLTKHLLDERRASGQAPDAAETARVTAAVAAELVGSGGVWAAFGAAELAKVGTTHGLTPLVRSLGDPARAVMIKSALTATIANALTLPAMAGASQLWEHAVHRRTIEDGDRGHNLIHGAIAVLAKPTVTAGLAEMRDQTVAFVKTLKDAGEIAFVDSSARDMWLYDTWRNGIMNRRSMTLLAGMQAGGMIGGAIGSGVPIVGTALGGGLGMAAGGGLAAGFVPDATQEALTRKLTQLRRYRLENRLSRCMTILRAGLRTVSGGSDAAATPSGLLDACGKVREGLVTLALDDLKRGVAMLKVSERRAAAARASGRRDEENTCRTQMLEANHLIAKARARILVFYEDQREGLESLAREVTAPHASHVLLKQEDRRLLYVSRGLAELLDRVPASDEATATVFSYANAGFLETSQLKSVANEDDTPIVFDTLPPPSSAQ